MVYLWALPLFLGIFVWQAQHDLSKAKSTLSTPTPTPTPQQLPKKDLGAVDQSNNAEAQKIPKEKRDVHVSVGPTVTQTPKHSIHPTSGISMQVPFHQAQVPRGETVPIYYY